MFNVQNTRTKKIVKDACTTKPWAFETMADAEQFAREMERRSVVDATAWNSVRRAKFVVVPA